MKSSASRLNRAGGHWHWADCLTLRLFCLRAVVDLTHQQSFFLAFKEQQKKKGGLGFTEVFSQPDWWLSGAECVCVFPWLGPCLVEEAGLLQRPPLLLCLHHVSGGWEWARAPPDISSTLTAPHTDQHVSTLCWKSQREQTSAIYSVIVFFVRDSWRSLFFMYI